MPKRDFQEVPPQDYENRDFLYKGIEGAKDLRTVADYVFAGERHLQDPIYKEQVWEIALDISRLILPDLNATEAEAKLKEEVLKLSQEKNNQ